VIRTNEADIGIGKADIGIGEADIGIGEADIGIGEADIVIENTTRTLCLPPCACQDGRAFASRPPSLAWKLIASFWLDDC
jgi:hypothetical protein